ncbi:MAG: Tat pathway signal sequence protein [Bacteroidetes bacterium]|nr:Tat pathway signal sequence protein [Bacteroidota bacterium]
MKKREFLRTLGLAGLGLAARPWLHSGVPFRAGQPEFGRKHWAWLATDLLSSPDSMQRRFAVMRKAGIDAILPEIYDGHRAYYKSAHLPVEELWLENLLPLARAEGLEVHGWMWSMPCNIEEVRRDHPEWFVVNRKGESAAEKPAYVDYYKFLCPSHRGVHEFLAATVTELCQHRDLAGVHLDYIRYPDVILPEALQPKYGLTQDREYPEFDYCYCDDCRNDFKNQTGIDPMTLENPPANALWRQFRYDRITHLVNDTLIPIARAHGKAITAAVFPDWNLVRQQWPAWKLDAVMPMLYHTLYKKGASWIREETEKGVRSLQGRAPLYSGILIFRLDEKEFTAAVEASLEGGANGVVLFEGGAMSDALWQAFRAVVGR